MNIIPLLIKEMEQESEITRKMLKRVPADKFSWKPHEKSMTMENLSVHLAELPGWVVSALKSDGIDFAKMDYKPTPVKSNEDLLKLFEESLKNGLEALRNASEDDLLPKWTLRNGDKILAEWTKYETIRHSFAQTTHHRAQLGVYLRLLNIPIPGSYGPSADEQM